MDTQDPEGKIKNINFDITQGTERRLLNVRTLVSIQMGREFEDRDLFTQSLAVYEWWLSVVTAGFGIALVEDNGFFEPIVNEVELELAYEDEDD